MGSDSESDSTRLDDSTTPSEVGEVAAPSEAEVTFAHKLRLYAFKRSFILLVLHFRFSQWGCRCEELPILGSVPCDD